MMTAACVSLTCRLLQPESLTADELSNFHSRDYVQTFKALCQEDDPEKIDQQLMDEYGLGMSSPGARLSYFGLY